MRYGPIDRIEPVNAPVATTTPCIQLNNHQIQLFWEPANMCLRMRDLN